MRLQRYKFMKPIYSAPIIGARQKPLFETTKIQIYETNLQLFLRFFQIRLSCLRLQRYKFMKPIYSYFWRFYVRIYAVWDYKDTNLWNQFTAFSIFGSFNVLLFETTKIQIYETNLQPTSKSLVLINSCLRLQRYKFMKPIYSYRFGA